MHFLKDLLFPITAHEEDKQEPTAYSLGLQSSGPPKLTTHSVGLMRATACGALEEDHR